MSNVRLPRGEKKRTYKRIRMKVGRVVVIMQLISGLLAVTVCVLIFNSLITGMLEDRCTNGTNMLMHEFAAREDGEDMTQTLDNLKELMGCEFTVFEGDTRAYTTVLKDGERAVGTKLSQELSAIVLEQGKSYVGEADILDEEYLCSYVPTKGADGQVNGLVFAGISMAQSRHETLSAIFWSGIVSAITIFICVLVLAAYLKKRVSGPLGEITQVALRLEEGDLGLSSGEEVSVNVCSNDEIGMLGEIFKDTMHRLRGYIGEIGEVLGSIADGNLTGTAKQDYKGDFLSIKQSLESIQKGLNNTMGQIATSAEQVSSRSEQVSGSAQALAQGATEQASSVQEISATIANLSENARQTADNAVEAGKLVNQAGAQLGVSMDYTKDLNVAMENMSNSSKEISAIIASIENIAFQINILALNAAVEAARAGEAGKGFAVVADEVGSLAAKSDEAAKATKELIESSITAVTEGARAVKRVTEALEETNRIAGGVTSRMTVVVDAVEDQTTAITQITSGMEQISAVVQNNSATSEECAAASQELSAQAGLLEGLMRSFRLKDTH